MPEDSNHSDLAPREETAVQPSPLPQAKPAAFESAINSHRFDVSFDLAELCNDAHVQVHAAVIKQADGTGKRSVSEKSWKKLLRDIARIIRLAEVPYFEFARASKETDEQAHIWAKSELRQVVYSELGLEDKQTPESTIFFKWAGDGSPDFASYHYVHGWNEPWRAYQWSVALRPRQLTAGQMLRVDWAADMSTLRASEKHTEAFLKRKKEELEEAIEIALLQAANQVRQRIARGSRLATAAEMTAPQASGADHARPGTPGTEDSIAKPQGASRSDTSQMISFTLKKGICTSEPKFTDDELLNSYESIAGTFHEVRTFILSAKRENISTTQLEKRFGNTLFGKAAGHDDWEALMQFKDRSITASNLAKVFLERATGRKLSTIQKRLSQARTARTPRKVNTSKRQ